MNDFDKYAAQLRISFAQALAWGDGHLYVTNKDQLDEPYLAGWNDGQLRQYHNCNACRSFLRRYGGLAVISKDGKEARSAFFDFVDVDAVPLHFRWSHMLMVARMHSQLRIRGIYESSLTRWGAQEAGGWTHFWADNPHVYKRTTLTAGQKMAEHRHHFETLQRALNEIPQSVFQQVANLMLGTEIKRAAKFKDLAAAYATVAATKNHTYLWHVLANSPAGFANIKSSALGMLYDDLNKGMDVKAAIARFNTATDARVYQQPTAAPKAGNVARAETIFSDLKLEKSLQRRILARDEVLPRCVWMPNRAMPYEAVASKGIFDNLRDDTIELVDGGTVKLSLRKFMEKACLTTASLTLLNIDKPHDFGFFTGPLLNDSEPLFAWSNPYSWVRFYDAAAADFDLWGKDVGIAGIVDAPSTWDNKQSSPRALMFLTVHGTPKRMSEVGSGITAEGLRSDLREVHRTIVMHARKSALADVPAVPAVGLIVREDDFKSFSLWARHSHGIVSRYDITSWE